MQGRRERRQTASREEVAWDPQGQALLDHLDGGVPVVVQVHTVGGDPEPVSSAAFFRTLHEMEPWELAALDRCGARVLDVGAGAGCHALACQQRGLGVVAVDTNAHAVEVMRRRGVVDARCCAASEVLDETFDTLLMLMHGVGLVGDLDGLRWMLADAHRLLAEGGVLLLDSRDPRGTAGGDQPGQDVPGDGLPEVGASGEDSSGEGLAVAELWMEYGELRGVPFPWLFLSAERLAEEAATVCWELEVLQREADGRYLGELRRS
jgi:SAM-dependent methyltransferase